MCVLCTRTWRPIRWPRRTWTCWPSWSGAAPATTGRKAAKSSDSISSTPTRKKSKQSKHSLSSWYSISMAIWYIHITVSLSISEDHITQLRMKCWNIEVNSRPDSFCSLWSYTIVHVTFSWDVRALVVPLLHQLYMFPYIGRRPSPAHACRRITHKWWILTQQRWVANETRVWGSLTIGSWMYLCRINEYRSKSTWTILANSRLFVVYCTCISCVQSQTLHVWCSVLIPSVPSAFMSVHVQVVST